MIALDTNVWVRYVTNDEPEQAKSALALIGTNEDIFLPITVLLEMEWVLRAVYKLPSASIEHAMLNVLGLPNVTVKAPEQVSYALELYRGGMDFADALHLSESRNVEAFYTFDEKFIKAARKFGHKVVSPAQVKK